jgi:SAM-dependent methyltransferase
VRFVRIDPPGTWLQLAAILDILRRHAGGRRFLEAGCGDGRLSQALVGRGYEGAGIDLSLEALDEARRNLSEAIARGRYALHEGSIEQLPPSAPFDFAISMMVAEHIEDDVAFVRSVAARVRAGGLVLIGVPGRRDRWSVEDETVGHLRRYDRQHLARLLGDAGLELLDVWSVAVPVANFLFPFGNTLIARSETETGKRTLDKREQTLGSGIRDIPFKTTFPRPFRLLLNRWTMLPFAVLQRAFYRSALGITLIGFGRVKAPRA